MKKYITLLLAFICILAHAQSKGSRYVKQKQDQVKYVTEAAYWKEFVKSTEKLYDGTATAKSFTDKTILVVSRFTPKGKKVRLFYKSGKLIGKKLGSRMTNWYNPRNKKKRSSRSKKNPFSNNNRWKYSSPNKKKKSKNSIRKADNNISQVYKKQRGDIVNYMSEKSYVKRYLRKKSNSTKKVMVVTRYSKKGKKFTLFYKNKRLIGSFINGKFFKN